MEFSFEAVARFAGSNVCFCCNPGAHAPGFMLSAASRTHKRDPTSISSQRQTVSFDRLQ